jgi:nicotinamidase-related amidase
MTGHLTRRQALGVSAAGLAAAMLADGRPVTAATPQARTLLDLAGARAAPARMSEAVLIIIDAQGEYRKGPLRLDNMEPAMRQVAALLGRARSAGTPIIHVAQTGDPGDLFDRHGDGGKFLPEVTPRAGEIVVEKPLPNAFARTDLQDRLTAIGRKDLIIIGFMTHMCVSSTVRAAVDLDYRVTVAADATATRALPCATGGPALPAAQIQASALAALGDFFAAIVPAAKLIV